MAKRTQKPSNTGVNSTQDRSDDSKKPDSQKENLDLSKIENMVSLAHTGNEKSIKEGLEKHLSGMIEKYNLQYKVLFLFDTYKSITSFHANEIYEAASTNKNDKDILLILQSGGGKIEPAYLISKTCKKLSLSKFAVAIPRRAKSAATLLALGADEIHMGLLSELGPIDPQINGYPALGLTNALNKVSELTSKYPKSSDVWAKYLGEKLDLNDLGYFDRVSESAAQYAERLMKGKKLPEGNTPTSLAGHFVNHYKDHSFVIDYDESIGLLGGDIIKTETPEYLLANEIYGFLNLFDLFYGAFQDKELSVIGDSTGIHIRSNKKS